MNAHFLPFFELSLHFLSHLHLLGNSYEHTITRKWWPGTRAGPENVTKYPMRSTFYCPG